MPIRLLLGRNIANNCISALAVLPFENLTGVADQRFIADGIVETLISRLGTVTGLRVISRTSAMAFAGGTKSISAIGHELGVNAVVEGSIMRSGSRVRMTARLIGVSPEDLIWQHIYDSEMESLLDLADQLADELASAITASTTRLTLNPAHGSRAIPPEAQMAYLKDRYLWNRRNEKHLSISASMSFSARWSCIPISPGRSPRWPMPRSLSESGDCNLLTQPSGLPAAQRNAR